MEQRPHVIASFEERRGADWWRLIERRTRRQTERPEPVGCPAELDRRRVRPQLVRVAGGVRSLASRKRSSRCHRNCLNPDDMQQNQEVLFSGSKDSPAAGSSMNEPLSCLASSNIQASGIRRTIIAGQPRGARWCARARAGPIARFFFEQGSAKATPPGLGGCRSSPTSSITTGWGSQAGRRGLERLTGHHTALRLALARRELGPAGILAHVERAGAPGPKAEPGATEMMVNRVPRAAGHDGDALMARPRTGEVGGDVAIRDRSSTTRPALLRGDRLAPSPNRSAYAWRWATSWRRWPGMFGMRNRARRPTGDKDP